MGMFDQILVKCPRCKKGEVYIQIKYLEESLDWINLEKSIVLDSDIGENWFMWKCKKCKKSFQSKLKAKELELTLVDREGKKFVIKESIKPDKETDEYFV